MSGSWEAMLEDEHRRSNLARRRALAAMRKTDLIDLVLLHERVNDDHETACVCVTCGLLHDGNPDHEIRRQP